MRSAILTVLSMFLCPFVRVGCAAEPIEQLPISARIAVVVHKNNPVDTVELKDLEQIFLRRKLKWPDGETITVFERSTEHPIRIQFSSLVHKKKPEEMAEYWLNLKMTRGLQAPTVCRSTILLKRCLERTRGGIGYLYEGEVDETMKAVKLLEIP